VYNIIIVVHIRYVTRLLLPAALPGAISVGVMWLASLNSRNSCYVCVVASGAEASNDRRCVNYRRASMRLAAPRLWSAAASADLRVWYGSGQNKFVQLLIRSRNSSGWFV